MEFIPVKCRIPELEREMKVEPYQVYEALGMSKQQYSAYRTNRRIPHLPTAKLIAEYFGCPVDDLHVWKKIERSRGRQKAD